MGNIERTYRVCTHALWRSHSPAFTRHWLKEKNMTEIPRIKSALKHNMGCPALLYCPEACETDMVKDATAS